MTELNIVPECYVDTKIAEILGQASRKYNHQHGCGDVANQLKNRLKNHVALGIVDEDKNKGNTPKYFSEFNMVQTENNLILKRHSSNFHHLVLVCPEAEKWLLYNADAVNISVQEYGFGNTLEKLTVMTKTGDIDKNPNFTRLIKNLLQKGAPGIVSLKKWIELFKSRQLDARYPFK